MARLFKTRWVVEEFAKAGARLTLLVDGNWDEGWVVDATFNRSITPVGHSAAIVREWHGSTKPFAGDLQS